jgi:hypothetical protein
MFNRPKFCHILVYLPLGSRPKGESNPVLLALETGSFCALGKNFEQICWPLEPPQRCSVYDALKTILPSKIRVDHFARCPHTLGSLFIHKKIQPIPNSRRCWA